MKLIYIAGKFRNRKQYQVIARELIQYQIAVTSRWIWEDDEDFTALTPRKRAESGQRDIADINMADTLILDLLDELSEGSGGGREFEAGIGWARGKDIWRVGPSRSIFHEDVARTFSNWEEFLRYVKPARSRR